MFFVQIKIPCFFYKIDGEYKDISSTVLLRRVCGLISQSNYEILNIDCTIVAQEPKLAPFIELIRQSLAHSMSVEVDKISVKATTTEGLGFEGRREGISSHAICALKRKA